jgi:hypothetical protein
MKFNGVELTAESIAAAHRGYADNARDCIAEVESGKVAVIDREQYIEGCEARAAEHDAYANGTATAEFRYSLAFLQYAYYLQTGESVALLP